jgi:hypothetical protein
VTAVDDPLELEAATVVVVTMVVVVVVRAAAFFTSDESVESELLQAARAPRLSTARKGIRRFLMCTLYTFLGQMGRNPVHSRRADE